MEIYPLELEIRDLRERHSLSPPHTTHQDRCPLRWPNASQVLSLLRFLSVYLNPRTVALKLPGRIILSNEEARLLEMEIFEKFEAAVATSALP